MTKSPRFDRARFTQVLPPRSKIELPMATMTARGRLALNAALQREMGWGPKGAQRSFLDLHITGEGDEIFLVVQAQRSQTTFRPSCEGHFNAEHLTQVLCGKGLTLPLRYEVRWLPEEGVWHGVRLIEGPCCAASSSAKRLKKPRKQDLDLMAEWEGVL